MIFKRKIYNELLQWKRTDEGRTAVLIQGARRVGKSTIAKEFAENEYETHILVDFAACSAEIRELFNDVSDLNRIFMRLQLEYSVELKERKSVIIFDEVQLAPKARQAIKYLVKDGRYDLVEEEIRCIKAACGDKILKVIIETCLLTDTEKIRMCEVVTAAKADFIKTSTGFSKAGATFDDIALFASHVGENVQIKAAGGISSFADADEFVKLGADRLGTSRLVKIEKQQ